MSLALLAPDMPPEWWAGHLARGAKAVEAAGPRPVEARLQAFVAAGLFQQLRLAEFADHLMANRKAEPWMQSLVEAVAAKQGERQAEARAILADPAGAALLRLAGDRLTDEVKTASAGTIPDPVQAMARDFFAGALIVSVPAGSLPPPPGARRPTGPKR